MTAMHEFGYTLRLTDTTASRDIMCSGSAKCWGYGDHGWELSADDIMRRNLIGIARDAVKALRVGRQWVGTRPSGGRSWPSPLQSGIWGRT